MYHLFSTHSSRRGDSFTKEETGSSQAEAPPREAPARRSPRRRSRFRPARPGAPRRSRRGGFGFRAPPAPAALRRRREPLAAARARSPQDSVLPRGRGRPSHPWAGPARFGGAGGQALPAESGAPRKRGAKTRCIRRHVEVGPGRGEARAGARGDPRPVGPWRARVPGPPLPSAERTPRALAEKPGGDPRGTSPPSGATPASVLPFWQKQVLFPF